MALAGDSPLFSQLPHRQAVKQTINPGADTTLTRLINHKVISPHTLPTRSYLPHLDTTREKTGHSSMAHMLLIKVLHLKIVLPDLTYTAIGRLLLGLSTRLEAV